MEKKVRQSNLELLRIISIFLIILMHTRGPKGSELEMNRLIGPIVNAIGNIGVTCFIMISGFFGVRMKPYKFIEICYLTTLYALMVYFFNSKNVDVNILSKVFVIPMYKNWFISCYLILMLLAPYIDLFCNELSKSNFLRLILILFVTFSVIPTFFHSSYSAVVFNGGKCLTYFIFIYLTGRFIRLHYNVNFSRMKCLLSFIVMTVIIFILDSTIRKMVHAGTAFAIDSSCFIFISALSFFFLFKSFSISNKIINWIASSVLSMYLLNDMLKFFDRFICLDIHKNSPALIAFILCEVLCVMLFALVVDKLRILLLSKIENKTIAAIVNVLKRLFNKLNEIIERQL